MPDSAVVARGRKKAAERGTLNKRPRAVKQPLAGKAPSTPKKASAAKKAVAAAPKTAAKKLTNAPEITNEPKYAETHEVQSFAAGLKDSFLQCRELGHQWKPWTAQYVEDGAIERILKCPRCKCERHQILTGTGAVYSNKYVHPKGYLHEGMGRIIGEGRDALRMESLVRTIRATDEKVA